MEECKVIIYRRFQKFKFKQYGNIFTLFLTKKEAFLGDR